MLAAVVLTADNAPRDRAALDRLAADYAGRGLVRLGGGRALRGQTHDWI